MIDPLNLDTDHLLQRKLVAAQQRVAELERELFASRQREQLLHQHQNDMQSILEGWKEMEEALISERQCLFSLLDSIPAFVCIRAPDYSVRFANRLFRERFGEPQGNPCYQVVWGNDAPCRWCSLLQVFQNAVPSQESELTAVDGRTYYLSTYPFTDTDGSLLTLELGIDITRHKQATEAAKQECTLLARQVEERTAELSVTNAELARATRFKDEFLASISHELRTPLNAILGLTRAMLRQVYGPLNNLQKETLFMVEQSGSHLLSLINDILDLSKIEAGKVSLNGSICQIRTVCQASLQAVRQLAREKHLQDELDVACNVTTLTTDERRLKQTLINLLKNAVKFTHPGGSVGLQVRYDEDRQAVLFTVWDTGIGMSAEDMACLFKPFIQLDSGLTRRYSGLGLGLTLAYRLTEMQGGSIAVQSAVGQGSQFTIALPIHQHTLWSTTRRTVGKTNEDAKTSHRSHDPDARLVLLAEHNEDTHTMLMTYLLGQGYRVVGVRNGCEAIERAREIMPDLLLVALQLPGLNGLDVVRSIRSDRALGTVPIMVTTALVLPGDRERCIAAGANDYLVKPLSIEHLLCNMGQLIGRKPLW